MRNKRGISVLISTLLIVLLVLIGVGSIWIFISQGGEKVDRGLQVDCFSLNLKPLKCEAYGVCNYNNGRGGWETEVLVRRDAGEGNLRGVRFLFRSEDSSGVFGDLISSADVDANGLDELETKNFKDEPFRIGVPRGFYPDFISLIPLVGKDWFECQVESLEISCGEPLNDLPKLGFIPGPSKHEDYCCQYPWNSTGCVTFEQLSASCLDHGCSPSDSGISPFTCTGSSTYSCASAGSQIDCEKHGCDWNPGNPSGNPPVLAFCRGNPAPCGNEGFGKPPKGFRYCCNAIPGSMTTTPLGQLPFPQCYGVQGVNFIGEGCTFLNP
jgi:hypothetical protein